MTLADNVQYCDAKHKVDIMARDLKIIALSDAWRACKQWPALQQIKQQLDTMLHNNMISEFGRNMLDGLVNEEENAIDKKVEYGNEGKLISALLCAQVISCNVFLAQAKAVTAMFENNVRHMGLPTNVNWMHSR